MKAVSQKGSSLCYAPEVVMEAASHDPHALQYATPELSGDREVVMEAVSQDPQTLRWSSGEIVGW